ncbi:MAG: HEAT repeat domain-containing protein [Deltaproteobacteria bacterium]|nr:HEAT repeat domain-containing protein [Deltaproteobacteria bacterium]
MAEEFVGGKKEPDLELDVSSIEGKDLDEAVDQAKDLINTFVKTIKAFRLYPPENPTLVGFIDQVYRKFQLFLNKYHYFILKIGENKLSFREVTLYENPDLKTSLAFQLYKDGLRELRFMEGLEEGEVDGLIDIMKRSDSINKMEDDLVTLMWEKDFIHISYLATDEYLEEMPAIIPANIEQFRANLTFEPPPQSEMGDIGEETDGAEVDYYEIMKRVESPPLVGVDRSVYFLTPDELEGLRKEVELETAPSFVFIVIDILFEILALEKSPQPYQETTGVLQKLLDALITLGEFQKASELLTRVNIILNTYELKDWQVDAIRQLSDKAGEPQRIEKIGKILDKGEEIRLEEVSNYLTLLKPNSIQPLIKVLGELNNSRARRMLCEVLIEIGKGNMELIIPFIDDHRWFLVRNIAYILGRMGKESALPTIQKALNHEEARVRREAIQALGIIVSSKAFDLLGKALNDQDDRNRSMAALNLARVGKKASLPALLEVVQAKDFSKRDSAEIKAFFDAIGMVGSNDAIKPLEKLLEQKSWFGMGKKDEIRLRAASALALIGTAEARSTLEAGRNSKDENIRQACLQAMKGQTP